MVALGAAEAQRWIAILMEKFARLQIFLVSTILLCSCLACEVDTKIELDGKNPPGFSLSGNGQLWFIGGSPSSMAKITYGVVPSGFTQEIPASGAPPALVEEKPYSVFANTSNANGDYLMFLIRGGTSLKVTKSPDGSYSVQAGER